MSSSVRVSRAAVSNRTSRQVHTRVITRCGCILSTKVWWVAWSNISTMKTHSLSCLIRLFNWGDILILSVASSQICPSLLTRWVTIRPCMLWTPHRYSSTPYSYMSKPRTHSRYLKREKPSHSSRQLWLSSRSCCLRYAWRTWAPRYRRNRSPGQHVPTSKHTRSLTVAVTRTQPASSGSTRRQLAPCRSLRCWL